MFLPILLVEVLEDEPPGSVGLEERCKNQRLNSHQLDEDVEGRSGGILEWVSNCVSNDSSHVRGRSLSAQRAGVVRCPSLKTH